MKRKTLRILLVGLLAFGAFYLPSAATTEVSAQAAQDFTVVNKTGVEIYALYVTPHDADEWGNDILGVDTLANGQTLDITFARKEKAQFWDLRIEDADGSFIVWESLNLHQIDTLTLFYKNGKATSTFVAKDWDLQGTWVGYYDDGTKSPYVWSITQNGTTLSIKALKGSTAKSRGIVQGSKITAQDFATKNGTVTDDGLEIHWSDGVVWVRQ
jgi:hypothetical protein